MSNQELTIYQLLPIQEEPLDDGTVQTVNARDLHTFLEVGKDFSNWIKDRIGQYGFTQDVDFVVFAETGENGGRPLKQYHLTLDMAKELSMVERNERGREARLYFIECEKKLKAPQQPTQSLEDAVQKEVKHLRAIGLDLETAFAAATKRVADERGIEHRLLIQSDEVTGRKPGWGQLPIKGISEEEVNKIREETRHKEMIWHPREIAERFNLYDRNGKADTRLVLRILEAAGQCRIIEPVSQTIEVTSEGKDVCYTLPRPFSDGRQYGNATRWEVAYFARCYLKFIDKHSYEFVNFKTY